MSPKGWMLAMIVSAVVTAPIDRCAVRAQQPSGGSSDQAAQRDVQQLNDILTRADSTQTQRDEAARRLMSREGPDAAKMLHDSLVNIGNRGAQLAVARALASNPKPDISYKDPLFALFGPDRSLTEAAAQALANYKGNAEVLSRLALAANANNADTTRPAVIKAIGTFTDKRAAEVLIEILRRPTENEAIQHAVEEALIDMTGLTENGQEIQRWERWWAATKDKPDDQWRVDLLTTRAAKYEQLVHRHDALAAETKDLLTDQYKLLPDAQRPERLLRFLKSPASEVRAAGALIVADDFKENKQITDATREQLRTMIGDSDPSVRAEVATSLGLMNDATALEALLTQLSQEHDPDVRAAIAKTLAPMGDLRAVPALIKLLKDDALNVAVAAAESLKDLGKKLHDEDPKLADQAATALKQTFEGRTAPGDPATSRLREACVGALVPLRSPDMLQTYFKLLTPRESIRVRIAALKGLGELREPGASATIVRALEDDPEPNVRLAAVDALGQTSNFENAEIVYRRLNPAVESDASIRKRAWDILQSWLPGAPTDQLFQWADRFKDDPARRLIVLKALLTNLQAARNDEQMAIVRQEIGETLMRLDQPDEAALYFRPALDYWEAHNPQVRTEILIEQLMDALLKSKQYADAADFASKEIQANASNQQTMGAKIRQEAERLRDKGEFQPALDLIGEVGKMNPPLASRYRDDLRIIESDVRQKLSEKGSGGDGPRSTRLAER